MPTKKKSRRKRTPKEKAPKGPFFISGCKPDRLPIHLRTDSLHSAEHHPAQAGRGRGAQAVAPQSTGMPGAGFHSSLMPFPLFFPIKHIQPAASDHIQTIAEKAFKPGLSSPISQCHRKLFGWCNKCFLLPVFQKFNPSYRQAL